MPAVPTIAETSAPQTDELQALFAQPYIDPLTDYLAKNQHDDALRDVLARVKAEREKRCADIALLYQKRAKTAANLAKLRTGYQRSCAHVVEAFAVLVESSVPSASPAQATTARVTKPPTLVPEAPSPDLVEPSVGSQTYAVYRQQVLLNCQFKLAAQDMQAVIDSCQRLARQGEALAQSYLGTAYMQQQQVAQAEYWWRKAAEQGLAQAQYHLGVLYAEGRVLKQDWQQSFDWLQRAALQGLSAAQYALGHLYASGHGVTQDRVEALAWWSLAAQQSHAQAITQQAHLRQQLTPLQWQQAQRRAQQLQQRYQGQAKP